jgi:hypothetical protein
MHDALMLMEVTCCWLLQMRWGVRASRAACWR